MYNFFPGNSLGWNKEVKCARAGVVLVQRKRYNTTKDFVEYNLMNIFSPTFEMDITPPDGNAC
jgi:hypothetical protein